MLSTVRRFTATGIYDLDGVQTWLDDMASRGYFLVRWGRHLCSFRKDNPDPNMRYRLEPVRPNQDRNRFRERRKKFHDAGWDYVCTGENRFHIFRAWDPFAPEPETDTKSMVHAMQAVLRQAWIEMVIKLSILFISAWLLSQNLTLPFSIPNLIESSGPLTLIQIILIPVSLIFTFYPFIPIRQIQSALEHDQVYPVSTAGRRLFIGIARWSALLVLIFAITDNAVCRHYVSQRAWGDPSQVPLPLLTLSELENRSDFVSLPFQGSTDPAFRSDDGTWAASDPSFWSPVHRTFRQEGYVPGVWWSDVETDRTDGAMYHPWIRIELWKTRGAFWAEMLFDGMREHTEEFNREKSLGLGRVNEARSYTSDSSLQLLICRKGNLIMSVRYRGAGTLTDHLPTLERLMSSDWNLGGATQLDKLLEALPGDAGNTA